MLEGVGEGSRMRGERKGKREAAVGGEGRVGGRGWGWCYCSRECRHY